MYRPKIYHSIWHDERKDRKSSARLRQADSSTRFAEIDLRGLPFVACSWW